MKKDTPDCPLYLVSCRSTCFVFCATYYRSTKALLGTSKHTHAAVFVYLLKGVLRTQWPGPLAATWTGRGFDLRRWAKFRRAVRTQRETWFEQQFHKINKAENVTIEKGHCQYHQTADSSISGFHASFINPVLTFKSNFVCCPDQSFHRFIQFFNVRLKNNWVQISLALDSTTEGILV